jgi:hypothetical protein
LIDVDQTNQIAVAHKQDHVDGYLGEFNAIRGLDH